MPGWARFGFGQPTGIDLLGEAGRRTALARVEGVRTSKSGWFPGETVIAGIGQGYWVVTPLQLASALATLPATACRYAPRLVMATQAGVNARAACALANPPSGPQLIHNPDDWNVVQPGHARR